MRNPGRKPIEKDPGSEGWPVDAGKRGFTAGIGLLEPAGPVDIHDKGARLVDQVHPCGIAEQPVFTG